MKYIIDLVSPEGAQGKVVFDQMTGELLGNGGERLFEPPLIRPTINPISPDNPGRKSGSSVKTLKIQLGLKCNYSCSYCTQTIHIPEGKDTYIADAESFISRLDEWLESVPERVEFWGGEPLVYFKKLKVLIPRLRARWPEATFLMITNGSLVTEEVVDFIIENGLSVAVSHDAQGQSLRSDDPLDDPNVVKALQRLVDQRPGQFSFNAVITPLNSSLKETVSFFKERFGDHCQVSFEGIVSYYNEDNIKNIRLTDEELSTISDEIFYGLSSGLLAGSSLDGALARVIKGLQSPFNMDACSTKCGMDTAANLTVDLLGNIMTCQNTGPSGEHYVGSVYDIDQARVSSSKHWLHRKNCKTCPMLRVCGGGCMFQNEADFSESCRADKAQAIGVFKAAIWWLTGMVVSGMRASPENGISLKQL